MTSREETTSDNLHFHLEATNVAVSLHVDHLTSVLAATNHRRSEVRRDGADAERLVCFLQAESNSLMHEM